MSTFYHILPGVVFNVDQVFFVSHSVRTSMLGGDERLDSNESHRRRTESKNKKHPKRVVFDGHLTPMRIYRARVNCKIEWENVRRPWMIRNRANRCTVIVITQHAAVRQSSIHVFIIEYCMQICTRRVCDETILAIWAQRTVYGHVSRV